MILSRFETYFEKTPNSCWIWNGGLTGKGYGKCDHQERTLGAHVVSYLFYKGEIPAGQIVRHSCHVKRCVNPEHLILGTYKDNMADEKAKGRTLGAVPKIDEATVFEIYRFRQKYYSVDDIANKLKLNKKTVNNIVCFKYRLDLKTKFEAEFGSIPSFNIGHKLTDDDVREIRRLYLQENKTTGQIAKLFFVSYKQIWKIVNYKQRTDVT